MVKTPRVLIVDDEETIQLALETAMEGRGWDITCVGNGTDAVKASEESPFDVLILDKNLPDFSGVEVLRKIREHDTSSRAIMLSGYANVESAVETSVLGIDAYLEKPLKDIFHIATVVETALVTKSRAEARQTPHKGAAVSLTAGTDSLRFLLRSAVIGGAPFEARDALVQALKAQELNPVVADSLEDIGAALQTTNLVFLSDPDPLRLAHNTRRQYPNHQIIVVAEKLGFGVAQALIDVGVAGIITGQIHSLVSRALLERAVESAIKRL